MLQVGFEHFQTRSPHPSVLVVLFTNRPPLSRPTADLKKKYEQLASKDKQRYEREITAYKKQKGATKGKGKAAAQPQDDSDDEEEEEDSDDE